MDKHTERTKKTYVLKHHGENLNKTWYVETYRTGHREKFTKGINVHHTIEGRYKAATELIEELKADFQPPPRNKSQEEKLYRAYEIWAPTVRKNSRDSYKAKLNSLFGWLDGRIITAEILEDFFRDYRNTHAQTTTHDCYTMLMLFFKNSGMEKLLNPISIKKGKKKPLKYFQTHQKKELWDYLEKHDDELLLYCQFVYYCFIRPRKELINLKVGDIDFDNRKIRIPGNISKNGKSQWVKIPRHFYPQIEHLKAHGPNEYIFPGRFDESKPVGKNTLGKKFRNILDILGYGKDYQVYSWKHTGVVDCANTGVPIVKIKTQLRHSKLDQTYDYMRQLGIEDMEDLADMFPPMNGHATKSNFAQYFMVNNDGLIIPLPDKETAKRLIFEKSVHVFSAHYKGGKIEARAMRA